MGLVLGQAILQIHGSTEAISGNHAIAPRILKRSPHLIMIERTSSPFLDAGHLQHADVVAYDRGWRIADGGQRTADNGHRPAAE